MGFDSRLVALYRCDELNGSDNLVDAVRGAAGLGTLVNSPAAAVAGVRNNARQLDPTGSDNYFQLGAASNSLDTASFTWMMHIKPTNPYAGGGDLVKKYGFGQPSAYTLQVFYSAGVWRFAASVGLWGGYGGSPQESVSVGVNPGWIVPGIFQHVALSWDLPSSTLRLFHNATLVETVVASNKALFLSHNDSYWPRLGVFQGGPLGSFDGPVDEVAYYDTALEANEIARAMGGDFLQPITTPPQAGDGWLINDAGDYELSEDGRLMRDETPATRGRIRLRTRRGEWFGDADLGSRLHQIKLMKRAEKLTEDYVREALQPMLDDGTYRTLTFGATLTDPVNGSIARVVEAEMPGENTTTLALPLGDD